MVMAKNLKNNHQLNFVNIFDKLAQSLVHPTYLQSMPIGLKLHYAKTFDKTCQEFSKIKLSPGWAVFFWNAKTDHVDHIAIVPKQKNLNLLQAKLIHGAPPPLGKAYGPLSSPIDYSGVRIASVIDFLKPNPHAYSKIIIGPPPALKRQIIIAGKIAKEVGNSGLLFKKPAFFSLPTLNKFIFVKWADYKNHSSVKLSIPHFASKKIQGNIWNWKTTYCGDLVGKIYQTAGITNLPKAKILLFSGYRSLTFYEWFRENRTLKEAIIWGKSKQQRF